MFASEPYLWSCTRRLSESLGRISSARHFAEKGAVAICADYRVKSRHNTTPFDAIADGKAAIAYVRSSLWRDRMAANSVPKPSSRAAKRERSVLILL